jgi:Zn-finger nucleic acid-binding protein
MSSLPSTARCPRDGAMLLPRMLDELEYLGCEGCGGLWIPPEQLQAMALRVCGGAPAPRSRGRIEPGRIVEGTARCVCARGALMLHVDAMRITLDRCRECGGVWLDGGEIHRVIQHYRGNRRSSSVDLDLNPIDLFDGADLLHGVFELLGALLEGLGDIC